jgi:tRNA pseudouridine55 synthase
VTGTAPAGAVAAVTEDAVLAGLAALTGEIDQVPSAVSAIKVDGRRAYARVRAGEAVTLRSRRVTVSDLRLVGLRRPAGDLLDADVMVDCSAGTYVRALARDLGARLGVGGHLTALRRTHVGPFGLADAATLDELAERPHPVTIPLDRAVAAAFARRDVDADAARTLSHGGRLPVAGIAGVHGVFGPDGAVVALVEERDGAARPLLVFAPG